MTAPSSKDCYAGWGVMTDAGDTVPMVSCRLPLGHDGRHKGQDPNGIETAWRDSDRFAWYPEYLAPLAWSGQMPWPGPLVRCAPGPAPEAGPETEGPPSHPLAEERSDRCSA